MPLIKKPDLHYSDYSWAAYANDDPRVSGEPDRTLFNRKEGYEVTYLVNKIAEIYGFTKKATGRKIEKILHDALPSYIRSQDKIIKWIDEYQPGPENRRLTNNHKKTIYRHITNY